MNEGARGANERNYQRTIEGQNDEIIRKLDRVIALLERLAGEPRIVMSGPQDIRIVAQCTCGTSAVCSMHGPKFVS